MREKYVPKHERKICARTGINMCQNMREKDVPKNEREIRAKAEINVPKHER